MEIPNNTQVYDEYGRIGKGSVTKHPPLSILLHRAIIANFRQEMPIFGVT